MKKIIFIILFIISVSNIFADRKVTVNIGYVSQGYEGTLQQALCTKLQVNSANEYTGEIPLIVTIKGFVPSTASGYIKYGGSFASLIGAFDFRDLKADQPASFYEGNLNASQTHTYLETFRQIQVFYGHVYNGSRWLSSQTPGGAIMPTNLPSKAPALKLISFPEKVTEIANISSSPNPMLSSVPLQTVEIDEVTPFPTNGYFDAVKANVTVYVPEAGKTAYEESWTGFKEIKTRRKIIFHTGDAGRVSFTYPGTEETEGLHYWYSNVGEKMEIPVLDDESKSVGWYKDEACTQEWDFESETVPASADPSSPTALHLYASAADKTYYTVRLHWDSELGDQEIEAPENTALATIFPINPSREGFIFSGWFADAELTQAFDPGLPPVFNSETQAEDFSECVLLTGNIDLWAKWESKPWLTTPFVLNIPEGGTLQNAFNAVFSIRTQHTDLSFDEIYGFSRLVIGGKIDVTDIGYKHNPTGYSVKPVNGYYSTTLRDKVGALDLREADIIYSDQYVYPANNYYTFECMLTYYYSIIQEIRLPIDGKITTLGSPFGHIAPSLKAIYVPDGITRIDGPHPEQCESPFAFTTALKDMYFDMATPPAATQYLWHQAGNFTLHVPEGSKSAYEADQWSDGTCKWTYASPEDGGGNVNITLAERPKVTFHTNGGSRPLYAYTPAEPDGTYYWYVNAGASAYSNNFPVGEIPLSEKDGYIFAGWFTDEDLTLPYEASTVVNLGEGGIDLYAQWDTFTGISVPASGSEAQVKGYYSIIGEKLPQVPEHGIYIILYSDGSAKKVVKN
jgi:uncharacterized repeat protein (TIGR02543 family)